MHRLQPATCSSILNCFQDPSRLRWNSLIHKPPFPASHTHTHDLATASSGTHLTNQLVPRWLVEKAEQEGRVVLTADRVFISAHMSEQAYFVQATTKAAQLHEVLEAFNITVTQDDLLSRCVKCNGRFLPE